MVTLTNFETHRCFNFEVRKMTGAKLFSQKKGAFPGFFDMIDGECVVGFRPNVSEIVYNMGRVMNVRDHTQFLVYAEVYNKHTYDLLGVCVSEPLVIIGKEFAERYDYTDKNTMHNTNHQTTQSTQPIQTHQTRGVKRSYFSFKHNGDSHSDNHRRIDGETANATSSEA
eukprot:GDKI01046176.1.p1 GENE.GDKI01046176.1~~GDKI01046176.1.p1  ORF type:complete len:169 (+),score=9.44 GDKI01046176.1:428-934(+)